MSDQMTQVFIAGVLVGIVLRLLRFAVAATDGNAGGENNDPHD